MCGHLGGVSEKVFVYGTLRKGASNNWRMEEADFLGEARVRGDLWKVDWYPGVILSGKGAVLGEVWEVSDEILKELDEFEGSEYRRVKVMAEGGANEVWIYEWLGDPEGLTKVESGDWLEVEGA